MRYFFDTEFIERGAEYPIDLISIGIVAEDGREVYLEREQMDLSNANDWVKENVIPHLEHTKHGPHSFACYNGSCPRALDYEIRELLIDFCDPRKYGQPEFWAYYADYDWVVFCQLFGTMMDLPKGWPMYCRDIKQVADMIGNPTLPKQKDTEHHALADARWNKLAYDFLRKSEHSICSVRSSL